MSYTLTNGLNKKHILGEFNFPGSKIAIAVNAKNEIVECISYDITNNKLKESILASMIYNGWIEDGKKQSALKYGSPKGLYQAFTFIELKTESEQNLFLKSIQF